MTDDVSTICHPPHTSKCHSTPLCPTKGTGQDLYSSPSSLLPTATHPLLPHLIRQGILGLFCPLLTAELRWPQNKCHSRCQSLTHSKHKTKQIHHIPFVTSYYCAVFCKLTCFPDQCSCWDIGCRSWFNFTIFTIATSCGTLMTQTLTVE